MIFLLDFVLLVNNLVDVGWFFFCWMDDRD